MVPLRLQVTDTWQNSCPAMNIGRIPKQPNHGTSVWLRYPGVRKTWKASGQKWKTVWRKRRDRHQANRWRRCTSHQSPSRSGKSHLQCQPAQHSPSDSQSPWRCCRWNKCCILTQLRTSHLCRQMQWRDQRTDSSSCWKSWKNLQSSLWRNQGRQHGHMPQPCYWRLHEWSSCQRSQSFIRRNNRTCRWHGQCNNCLSSCII